MTVLYICLALLLFVLLFSYIIYRIVFYSSVKTQIDIHTLPHGEQYQQNKEKILFLIDNLNERPYEPVTIISHDGLTLFGRYYHHADGAPLDIGFHGYHSAAVRDFAGGVNIIFDIGHNLLLVDQRAQGKSEGHAMTFGIQERLDCLDWINYAIGRFGKDIPIMLYGVSMGASTVLMAADLHLPENVRGIIADCPFSSPKAIIKKVCRDVKMPAGLFYPFISLGAFLFARVRLDSADAVSSVRDSNVPVLLIHGDADRFVPCEMSLEIEKARSENIRLCVFPGAGHGFSYMSDPEKYKKTILDFVAFCEG